MIWLIVMISVVIGYCLASALYFSDLMVQDALRRDKLGPYAGWKEKK